MPLSDLARITVPPDVMVREVSGESFILNVESGHYYGLNPVGTRMFTVMSEGASVGETARRLEAEFEVDPARLRQDLENLLSELGRHGLIQFQDERPAP